MCEPTTIAYVASLALTAIGTISGGKAQKDAGEANARIREQIAKDALDRGNADVAENKRRTAAFQGQQRAAISANGVEVNSGVASTILADSAQLGELDNQRIRNNAEREAYYQRSQGAVERTRGKNAFTSSLFTAAGTLLSGAGSLSAPTSGYSGLGSSGSTLLTNGTRVNSRWARRPVGTL